MTGPPSEIRQNKLTREWVIFAPDRGARPKDYEAEQDVRAAFPVHEEACPFCPGNEAMLPGILLELPHEHQEGWQTRVVPNKFPALRPHPGGALARQENFYISRSGYGRHEVIIEHPRHNRTIPQMSEMEMERVIETYQMRWLDLAADGRIQYAVLFRNHGPRAGTSLIHPHSQLIAAGVMPRTERLHRRIAHDYYDQHGRCLLCDVLNHERESGQRLVLENDGFAAFVPFAAEVPFETWLVPKTHAGGFDALSDGEKRMLGQILQKVLIRLAQVAGDPDYNYVIHSPLRCGGDPSLHWYLQIKPLTTTRAGFEIGSGMHINPSLPEEDASRLHRE